MSNGTLTTYNINITMDANTVTELQENQFMLFGFSGVDGPTSQAYPTVWFTTSDYSTLTEVQWQEQYAGYTSTQSTVAPGTVVTASFSAPMALGQVLNVTNAGGVGSVANGGPIGEIEIDNQTTTPFTCGISVVNSLTGSANPICAFPLFGNGLDVFTPVELVCLMFATSAVNTGTVLEQSLSQGILVNMTGQTTPTSVTFDINDGWSGPGNTTILPPNTNLVPLLINNPNLQDAAARSERRALLRRR